MESDSERRFRERMVVDASAVAKSEGSGRPRWKREISAIWLTMEPVERSANARILVDVEYPDGSWHRAITQYAGGHVSHCTEMNHDMPECEPGIVSFDGK